MTSSFYITQKHTLMDVQYDS